MKVKAMLLGLFLTGSVNAQDSLFTVRDAIDMALKQNLAIQIASTDPDYIGPLSTQLVKKMEKELQNP